jgi:rfaE bifunctional protein kinase chain/domain/rfaE bifunctional protein nucleotidyltransferase chain/domain
MINHKILSEVDLKKKILELKRKKKTISHCHGVFDLLHLGHIKHFEEAKSISDILIVSLTSDKFVNKGPGRPHFDQKSRLHAIASLETVDFVCVSDQASSLKVIGIIKPNFYFKGPDYKNFKKDLTNKIKSENQAVKKNGGKLFISKSETFSSSNLLNQNFSLFSDSQKKNISKIRKLFNLDNIKDEIEKLKKTKILIIGEMIIDEYNFCSAIGKSNKDPIMIFKDLYVEKYIGGAGAIAKNLMTFSKNIELLTVIGQNRDYENFIKKEIGKKIKLSFIYKKNSPTIVKRRIIDKSSNNKVLGIYKYNDEDLDGSNQLKLKNFLKKIKKYDLVIISDFGHGFLNNNIAKKICKEAKFTSANFQLNSANKVGHNLNRYLNAKSLVINESEMRYEMRNSNEKIEQLMIKLKAKLKLKYLIVTRGTKGAILCNEKNFFYSDAFALKAVDKVGAGDTFFSLASYFLAGKTNLDLSMFLSSLAAAYNVENIGNSKALSKSMLIKTLDHILK